MKKRRQVNQNGILRNEKGMVLAVTLMLIAALALLGTTTVMTITTDLKIAGNYRESARALYNAEAGVHAVIAKIDECGFTWPAIGSSQTVTVTAPSGYSFDNGSGGAAISVTKEDKTYYWFQVTGYGTSNSNARKTIKVYFRREPFGVFAEGLVDLGANSHIYSYNSNTTPNPNPANYPAASTGKGYVGTNVQVHAQENSYISGNIGLGASSGGDDATYDPSETTTLTGISTKVCRVAPDPLGAVGGELAINFTTYSSSNDNAAFMTCSAGACTASPGKINTGMLNSVTLTGKTGGSNFYFTEITLEAGATLTINPTDGPVNIYLTGKLNAKTGSTIIINGLPPSLTIYSKGNENIELKHFGNFKGTVYAPYAKVIVKNNTDFFGLMWGNEIDIQNTVRLFYDEALKNELPLNDGIGIITSWKDVM